MSNTDEQQETIEEEARQIMVEILYHHFGDDFITSDRVDGSVCGGDPHGWTQGAVATILTESCLPDPVYGPVEAWCRVFEDAAERGLHCEPINGAVIGVYPL